MAYGTAAGVDYNEQAITMPIITHDRPDPKFYSNIIQYDDGNWAADPIPVDDTISYPAMGGYAGSNVPGGTGPVGIKRPGVRTNVSNSVADQAMALVNKYAPPDLQRNALNILATQPTGSTAYINAKAMMDWIASVNSYRDTEIAHVKTLNFNQLVVYQVPAGTPPWPVPPASLPPVTPVMRGTAAYRLRFG